MEKYVVIKDSRGNIISISRGDRVCIPECGGNQDYQQYLFDVASGVVPTVEITPDPEPDTTIPYQPQINDLYDALLDIAMGG